MVDRSVWVLGARGFLGRYVAREASARGMRVLGTGHGMWLEDDAAVWGVSTWVNGEIDEANLEYLVSAGGIPDAIFHCAGGSSVGASLQAPYEDFSRSVGSTARVLEWMRRNAPQCVFVFASSAAVYGGGHFEPITEKTATLPAAPYGFHKLAAELLVRSNHLAFGVRAAIVRPFSLYGEMLRKQLLWDICRRLQKAPPELQLGGAGTECRDFFHVEDAAHFFVNVKEHVATGESGLVVVNAGTGIGRSIETIAIEVLAAWGSNAKLCFSGADRRGDPTRLVADVTLARRMGLRADLAFAEGVRRYVAWFKAQQVVE